MENDYLVRSLIISVRDVIRAKVDEEIDEEVNKFRERLESRRDQYIAEIMKGIRIANEYDPNDYCMNYKITFENVMKIERSNNERSE